MAGWSRDSGCDWGFPRRIEIHFFFFSFFFLPFSPGGFENPPHVTLTFIETGLSYHRTSAQVCDAPDGEGNLVTIHFLVAGQGKRRENLSSNTTHTLNIFAKKKKERKKKEERRKKDKSGIQKAKGETRAGEGRGRIAGWAPPDQQQGESFWDILEGLMEFPISISTPVIGFTSFATCLKASSTLVPSLALASK